MKRNQIVLVVVGIVAVIVMFSMSKVIVKPTKTLVENTETTDTTEIHHEGDGHDHSSDNKEKNAHQQQVSPELLKKASDWKIAMYNKAITVEEKKSVIDSLRNYYIAIFSFDSLAYLEEDLAELDPSLENIEKAADAYVQAFSIHSNDPKADKLNKKARKLYDKVLKKDPNNLDIVSKKAMTFVSSDNPMQGIKLLRDVIEKDPNNQTAIYNLGILSIQSGQYDKAIERFDKLVNINPQHSAAWYYLGMSNAYVGNKNEAIAAYKQAMQLERDPEFRANIQSQLDQLQ